MEIFFINENTCVNETLSKDVQISLFHRSTLSSPKSVTRRPNRGDNGITGRGNARQGRGNPVSHDGDDLSRREEEEDYDENLFEGSNNYKSA
ncbi:hypothetical protein ACLOJK_022327, partial [Asimina triloba]